MAPQAVIGMVGASNLRGRGGAGFPTGIKWASIPRGPHSPSPKYFVVDADEMEPGTFKDRFLMEGDPNQLIEGIIIGSYAIESDTAYLFIRNEYKLATRRVQKAIAEAYEHGYLGRNILGTDYSLELHVHISAGRYICGEGSALARSLEGRRRGAWHQAASADHVRVVGQAHKHEQCRDPVQYSPYHQSRSRVVQASEPMQGRRHQDLRGERQGQEARCVGVAYGDLHT